LELTGDTAERLKRASRRFEEVRGDTTSVVCATSTPVVTSDNHARLVEEQLTRAEEHLRRLVPEAPAERAA
jgi:hypothetical protein